MRSLLLLVMALLAVSASLECYVGKIPNTKGESFVIPKLTKCSAKEKCCFAGGHYLRGKYFKCEAECPDFKGKDSVSTSNSEGFQKWCVNSRGDCKYNV